MSNTQPNTIYIVCHDLGRTLGCYGEAVKSPHLDRFAAEGALFTTAFCAATACSPSRGCAWSGQYSHNNGLMGLVNGGWSMPNETRTVVDYFNDAGYHTAISGLDHVRKNREDLRFQEDLNQNPRASTAVDAAIQFLEGRQDEGQPFYLNLGTAEVHSSRWLSKHHFRNRSNPNLHDYARPPRPEDSFLPSAVPDFPPIRREMANFQAAIEFLDYHLGRLLNAIDRLGFAENTVIMFTTDHGIDGLRSKGRLYDKGMELALMMRGPGIEPGTVIDHQIQNIDYTPTFLEAAGVDIRDDVDGKSFWPVFAGGEYSPSEMVFAERNYHGSVAEELYPDGTSKFYDPMRSVRTKDFHLIRNFGKDILRDWTPDEISEVDDEGEGYMRVMFPELTEARPEVELFDLRNDPLERNDVSNDPNLADTRAQLLAALDDWMQDTDAPLLEGTIPDWLNGWPPED
jgi:arylsulfatase A-like enzyme